MVTVEPALLQCGLRPGYIFRMVMRFSPFSMVWWRWSDRGQLWPHGRDLPFGRIRLYLCGAQPEPRAWPGRWVGHALDYVVMPTFCVIYTALLAKRVLPHVPYIVDSRYCVPYHPF